MNELYGRMFEGFIIFVIVVPICLIFRNRKSDRLKSEGKIIDRKPNFARYTEVFLLRDMPFENICDAIVNTEYYGTVNVVGNIPLHYIIFKGEDWTGYFTTFDSNESIYNNGGMKAYQYSFLEWNARQGSTFDMNIAMTAMEKALLKLDPMTQVAIKRDLVKTKTKL